MYLKIFDRIQTSRIFRMNAYEKSIKRDIRAAGNDTEIKTSNDVCDNKAVTKPEGKENTVLNKPVGNANDAKPVGEADMGSNTHIKDSNPGVIDLGFGVTIDQKKMCGPTIDPATFQAAINNPGPTSNPYIDYVNNPIPPMGCPPFAPPPPPGTGRHKVDTPKPPKVEVKKAEEDNVNVDLNNISIETNPPKPPKAWPESVSSPLPQAGPVETEVNAPAFDNSAVTSRQNCRYLKDIENLALECGVQIQMMSRMGPNGEDSGLISCIVYTPESYKPNPYKGFTIDTGMIIDRRAKVFPGIVAYGFEDMKAYPVLIPKEDEKGGKSKNTLNEKLFRDIFTGGVKMLESHRSMYNDDYMILNKYVALITMPTQHMNKETRKAIQDRLMKAMKAGVFKSALEADPGSRFRFKPESYDKKTLSFILTNENTPYRFCGPVSCTKGIEIVFGFKDGEPTTNINYL